MLEVVTRPASEVELTAKESEVLSLVKERLTNAEIAARLFVSVRTVESHVSSVLRKVGAANRRELAAMTGDDTGNRLLPALRTEVIGRDDMIIAVSDLVRRVRLSTLVGPGGVGKTTVALAVAHGQADRWPDGVAFVDLVPASTPGDVLRTISEAMGIDGAASRSPRDLADHLATRSMLLLLDNCEHVVGYVAELLHIALGQHGNSHVLATSREPLNLADEHLVPIEPLGATAARLFVERARQSDPKTLWDETDERIVDVCARLDGLPLALELAAGQLRRWDLTELHRRLVDSDQRLPERPVHGEPRHRTMDNAISWSYGLLDEREQQLLRHLGVFPSTVRLDAVESLLDPLDADIAETLASLVDKSLVAREVDGSYRLLETIRRFAIDRLDDDDEREAVFEAHRRWMVERATATSRVDRWFSARLAASQNVLADDVRQAFWASLRAGRLTDAVDLAMTRSMLWRNAVGSAEGHRWVDSLIDRDLQPADAAWVGLLVCDLALGDGDFLAMVTAAERVLSIAASADADANGIAQQYAALRYLLDPAAANEAVAAVLAIARDARLANLVTAMLLSANAGRLDFEEMTATIDALDAHCSPDGYDRFIYNWAVWMHGLALRDAALADRGIGRQYDFLRHVELPETWLTAYSLAVTQMIDGVSGRAQMTHALAIADREGYRIEGDCMLALAYSEACAGNATAAGELLGLAAALRFNATAHYVLHGVVVEPLVRALLNPDEFADAATRGASRSVHATMALYGIGPAVATDSGGSSP